MPDVFANPPPGEVIGTAGNDRLYSGKAADRVDGLAGVDTFVVAINFASGRLHSEPDGLGGRVWMVGEDTLIDVEYVQFADLLVRLDDPALRQSSQHVATNGADVLIGNDLGYGLSGGDGDDILTGNGGDDALYGGKGNDTAVFRGNRADYSLSYDTYSKQVFVSDQASGRDGRDVLGSIETLRFADGEVDVASLLSTIPSATGLPTAQTAPGTTDWAWNVYVVSAANEMGTSTWAVESIRTVTTSDAGPRFLVPSTVGGSSGVDPIPFESEPVDLVDLVGLSDHRPWTVLDHRCEP